MKFLLSFVALVSLFTFLGNSEMYKIPKLEIPLSALNFKVEYAGYVDYFPNYSSTPRDDMYSVTFSRLGNNVLFCAFSTADPINYTNIPFGYHLFRNDLKNLYYYPVLDMSFLQFDVRHRCENQGPTTIEGVLAKFADYIDLGHSVRDKEIFTDREVFDPSNPDELIYSYTETQEINEEKYDKVNITYFYVVDTKHYNLTTGRGKMYTRHLRDGDFELFPFAQDILMLDSNDFSFEILNWSALLAENEDISSSSHYNMNYMEALLNPNLFFSLFSGSLVCPEIDHLPVPSLTELLPSNFTEYQLILETPVCVEKLMVNLADMLNLTSTHPERVAYSGIEKIGDEWAVDVIMPTDLGEILSTAVTNRDVRKSGYDLVGKIVRMVSKKSGK